MNAIARRVVEQTWSALAAWLLLALALAWLAGELVTSMREQERLAHLQAEAVRRSGELTAQTVNSHLMGALNLLGLIDAALKREARGEQPPNGEDVRRLLEIIAQLPHVDSAFVVDGGGMVRSSLGSGRSSTGLDVRFRPYFQTAMTGRESVYAAVGSTSGNRTLYFAAPIRQEAAAASPAIGAIVARVGLTPVDRLLAGQGEIGLLLSPQGVVFAASRPDWIGHLAGSATPERIAAIRDLKQFGGMFEEESPSPLPLAVDDGVRLVDGRRQAVAGAAVRWNDPGGEWRLVLVEDLSRTLPPGERLAAMAAAFATIVMLGLLAYVALRSRYRQYTATRQLDAYAKAQAMAVQRKERLAAVGLKLQQARTPAALARVFLSESADLLGGLQGVVYVTAADGSLRLAASYACTGESPPPATLAVGEGLLGQCAAGQEVRVLASGTTGVVGMIRSGLGEHLPVAVLMAPVRHQQPLLGAVEIALLEAPDSVIREQFDELLRLLAMNLELAALAAEPKQGNGA